MLDALIGYTGFVGSTLRKQHNFGSLFNSKNAEDMQHRQFDTVVCAGAYAQKWVANQNPDIDAKHVEKLLENVKTLRCKKFILISTVDVFTNPVDVDEGFTPNLNNHAYGMHRYQLELSIRQCFPGALIVRLPGLVGPGLRKNVIYDMLNNNKIETINPDSEYQFYPMVNLWSDLVMAQHLKLDLVHLTSAPVATWKIARECFDLVLKNQESAPAKYDMKSKYAFLFDSPYGAYNYGAREVLTAIRAYAQSI